MTPPCVIERAPAKINLGLRILSLEPDGYHALDTIFQALELHDTLEAGVATETTLEVAGDIDAGPLDDNLVLRAARAFRDAVPDAPHLRFRLDKRIPAGAGLGGGSSDAAAALRALNAFAGAPLEADAMRALGATVGADVAFFLCGSPLAHATGRGEVLRPLPPLPSAPVIVVDPGFPVSTREAFGWWDALSGRTPVRLEDVGDPRSVAELARAGVNDFESVVFTRHPVLARVRDLLLDAGASAAHLSGSGACVYGVADGGEGWPAALDARIASLLPSARLLRTRTLDGPPTR